MTKTKKEASFLTEFEYAHLTNVLSGKVSLLEGPCRIGWKPFHKISTISQKIVLRENEFVIILNPFDHEMGLPKHGEREVRIGPSSFPLYPGEEIEGNSIRTEYVLDQYSGLQIDAIKEFEDDGVYREAGDSWLIQGPCRFIPNKYIRVIRKVTSLSMGENEGVYVKNINSGDVRLIKGPCAYTLDANEVFYEKTYSTQELIALKRYNSSFDRSRALPIYLSEQDVTLIVSGEKQRVEFGPKVILLEPFERINIMSISGSTPKIPDQHTIFKVFVGPSFLSDQLCVRTRDNAELVITLRYKTRFRVIKADPIKIFAVEDFIGYATETLAAIIRQEVALHDFEELHSNAGELISKKVFSTGTRLYEFAENGFQIFGIDIKKIIPSDPEIAAQLNAAIKSNMEIFVQKMHQSAELEAERQLVEGKTEIEETKKILIELQQKNKRLEKLSEAEIDSEAMITLAKAEAEKINLIESEHNKSLQEHTKNMLELLKQESTEELIRLKQVESFNNVEKTVVIPSDSKIFVPLGQTETSKKNSEKIAKMTAMGEL